MEDYAILRLLGEGTFGRVYLARHWASSDLVALKVVRIKSVSAGMPKVLMREIQALSNLSASAGEGDAQSRHVVRMRDHFASGSSVVLVLEYMRCDLLALVKSMGAAGETLSARAVKQIVWMILRGVQATHQQRVMHRDLKPSNLLFSPRGCLKLGDFGLARVHATLNKPSDAAGLSAAAAGLSSSPLSAMCASPSPLSAASSSADDSGRHSPNVGGASGVYSHEVATRWYRSVELLYGSRRYGFGVDNWACGAMLFELLNASGPLFAGQNDIDQLYRVLRVTGSPTPENWPGHETLPDWGKIEFPFLPPTPLRDLCHPTTSAQAVDLMERLLTLDPARRWTATQALAHPWFDEIRPPTKAVTAAAAAASPSSPNATAAPADDLDAESRCWHEEEFMELAAFPSLAKQFLERRDAEPVAGAAQSAAPNATAAAASKSVSPAPLSPSSQLRALHLSGVEWTPTRSLSGPLLRALGQLPRHVSVAGLARPASLDDICSC